MKASEFVIISVQKNTWEAKEEYFDLDFDCLYLNTQITDGTCCTYVGKTILVFETNSFKGQLKPE